jgi:hypothetical protein
MTTIFNDGQIGSTMETAGDFSAWTSTTGSPTVQTSVFHHGANAMQATGVGNQYAKKTLTATNPVYARCYVYFTGLPTSNTNRLTFMSIWQGTAGGYEWVDAQIYNNAGTVEWSIDFYYGTTHHHLFSTATYPSINTWYCVEIMASQDGSNTFHAKMYVDGTLLIDQSATDSVAGFQAVIVGGIYKSSSLTNYVDCVVVAGSYIGPEGTITLQTVSDALTLNEGVFRNKLLSITDLVGLQDFQTRNKNLSILENVEIDDFVQALKALAVTEAFSLTDTVFTPSKIIQITEEISLAEVAFTGEGGVKKTRLFLILGEFALQLTGD